jgi:hypothetical protein
LLQSARAGRVDITRQIEAESLFRYIEEGEELGLIEVQERVVTIDDVEGVQILQRAWLFRPDDEIHFLQEDKFLGRNLSYERWVNRTEVLSRADPDGPQKLTIGAESGIRRDDKILLSYTPDVAIAESREKIIDVEAAYASQAWTTLFPRIVALDKPELYAFSTYESDRRGLVLRTFRVVGAARAGAGGTGTFRVEESEGLIPPVGTIDVDARGRVLRAVAGPVEIVATTRSYLEQRYGNRIKEAQHLFREAARRLPGSVR